MRHYWRKVTIPELKGTRNHKFMTVSPVTNLFLKMNFLIFIDVKCIDYFSFLNLHVSPISNIIVCAKEKNLINPHKKMEGVYESLLQG